MMRARELTIDWKFLSIFGVWIQTLHQKSILQLP